MRTLRIAATILLLLATGSAAVADVSLFVAPSGSDANPGTEAKPLATLAGARDAVRRLHSGGKPLAEAVTVWFRGGDYLLREPCGLSADDSGSAACPVTYRSYANERVRFVGGAAVSRWSAVTDPAIITRLDPEARPHVVQANLAAIGYRGADDPLALGGAFGSQSHRAELFYDDRPMTLARWPNTGFATIAGVTGEGPKSEFGLNGSTVGKIAYSGDRPSRWVGEKGIRLHGYWFWDWSDEYQQVASIDTAAHLITLAPPYHAFGYRKGQRYYAENLLSELDSPGEYYIDRAAGILYFWPPSPGKRAIVSLSSGLVDLRGVSCVTFRGITFEAARANAITVTDCDHVTVAGCTIRNVGAWGVSIEGGSNDRVVGCDITDTGDGGVSMAGGDRKTLTPGGHVVDNCLICRYARLYRTYQAAVDINGVGNRISHCAISDAPHCGILLTGNNHVIEYNDISHVCYESGDVGAFYVGRDWTARGNIVRSNAFHDISGPGMYGAKAVYLDDCASGESVTGNLFYNVSSGIELGGGRDNLVDNNVFVNCSPAIAADARGLGWAHDWVVAGGTLVERLKAMPYTQPPWSTSYPQLVPILRDDPGAPKGIRITHNISAGGWLDAEPQAKALIDIEKNVTASDPRFTDAAHGDFSLRPDSPALTLGIKPLDTARAGLYDDPLRASRPAKPTR